MRVDKLGADGDPTTGNALTDQGVVLQHLVGGGTGQVASNGAPPNHPRQGEVMNQVQSPEASQEQQEAGLKIRLHHRSKVCPGGRDGYICLGE